MSTLQILCPNGRRQNVKINPNTKLLQVIEEVCQKQKFLPAEDYKLIHGRTTLDLTLSVRYANLANNAKLELVKSEKSRAESEVVIALQLESGQRLQHTFQPATSLWDILMYWENVPDSPQKGVLTKTDSSQTPATHPVCIYMREEVVGEASLRETKLRTLGLTGGRAALRLAHRPVDDETMAEITAKLEKAKQQKARLEKGSSQKSQDLPQSTSEASAQTPPADTTASGSKGTETQSTIIKAESTNISLNINVNIQSDGKPVKQEPESGDDTVEEPKTKVVKVEKPESDHEPMEVEPSESADSVMDTDDTHKPKPEPDSTSTAEDPAARRQAQRQAADQLRAMNIPGVEIFTPDDFAELTPEQQQVAQKLAEAIMPRLGLTGRGQQGSANKGAVPKQKQPTAQPFAEFKFPEETKGKKLYDNEMRRIYPLTDHTDDLDQTVDTHDPPLLDLKSEETLPDITNSTTNSEPVLLATDLQSEETLPDIRNSTTSSEPVLLATDLQSEETLPDIRNSTTSSEPVLLATDLQSEETMPDIRNSTTNSKPVLQATKLLSCDTCGKQFKFQRSVKRHKRLQHEKSVISCRMCSRCFDSESELKEHNEKRHQTEICPYCGKNFARRYLKFHIATHEGTSEKKQKCPSCDRSFASKDGLTYHISKVHTGLKPYSCSECQKSFRTVTQMKNHELMCKGDKVFKCGICNKTFTSKRTQRVHSESQHGLKTYTCKCGKMFKYTSSLYKHKKTCKDITDGFLIDVKSEETVPESWNSTIASESLLQVAKLLSCDTCGKQFKFQRSVKRHKRLQHEKSVISCRMCSRCFDSESELKEHNEKRHQTEICPYCGKNFARRYLSVHIAAHEGTSEKKQKCPSCDRSFASKDGLTYHISKVHTGLKPYSCSECQKSFRTVTQMKNHELMCKGDKVFKCGICSKTFTSKRTQQVHSESQHGLKTYTCKCGKMFKYTSSLYKHKKMCKDILDGFLIDVKSEETIPESWNSTTIASESLLQVTKLFLCDTCGKQFKFQRSVKRHKRLQHEKSVISCRMCSRCFDSESELKEHNEKRHQTEICPYCGKNFARRYLSVHIAAHEGTSEKKQKCPSCDRSFASKDGLTYHVNKVHLGPAPFSCSHCPQSFRTETQMKKHELVCKGDNVFECDTCNKTFASKRSQQVHSESQHSLKTFRCRCGEIFKHNSSLYRHKKKCEVS